MAMIVEEERCMITERNKAALAAAKARGVALGSWRGGPKVNGRRGAEAQQRQVQAFAAELEDRQ
jgi:DNA invertase Pin-like site-specific DNA recombinase